MKYFLVLFKSTLKFYKTILESGSVGNASSSDEELEQWEQIFMMRDESGNTYNDKRKKRSIWCRPSCIPVSIVMILIVLVVLLPLLDQPNIVLPPSEPTRTHCPDQCQLSLVETIPTGQLYPPHSTHTQTRDIWSELIETAERDIEIASFYWSLRLNEQYSYNSSIEGEKIFQALYKAGLKRKINIRIAQNMPTQAYPNVDTEYLARKKAAQVRSLNFSKLLGSGVLHTKFWIVDRTHFYIGSANMDWRSLTEVKELGIVAYNCSCLATDLAKVFDVYWRLGAEDATLPATWPAALATRINIAYPANVTDERANRAYGAYISSSPPPFSPSGRSGDGAAIVAEIDAAEHFVYVAVMDYAPALVYTPTPKLWPEIDSALRRAALERRVAVRLLVSWWNHSAPSQWHFLRSLAALSGAYPRMDIQVKRFIVPSTPEQAKIPFARVNHNKYMVTDRAAYIGTSNWSGDYFTSTAGVALVLHDENSFDHAHNASAVAPSVREQLLAVFERDWTSPYAVPLTNL